MGLKMERTGKLFPQPGFLKLLSFSSKIPI